MKKQEIYKKILEQFNYLSEEEKQAIIIYKSMLFYHINEISSIENFIDKDSDTIISEVSDKKTFIERYTFFKNDIEKEVNKEIKNKYFRDVDFTSINTLIDSLKKIYNILNSIDMKLENDLVVYRGVSYDSHDFDISKSNLISTTIDEEVCADFLFKKKKNRLYVISLPKNSQILVCPYSVKSVYDSEIDYIMNRPKKLDVVNEIENGQQEVILFKNKLNFQDISTKVFPDDNLDVIRVVADVKQLENDKNKHIY